MVNPTRGASLANVWAQAATGDVASIQRAVEADGIDPDLTNKLGEAAAHLAARNGHVSRHSALIPRRS